MAVNGLLSKRNFLFISKQKNDLIDFSTQKNVTALLEELKLETYAQYHTGKSIAELRRHVQSYSLQMPYVSLLSFLESVYNVFRVKYQ